MLESEYFIQINIEMKSLIHVECIVLQIFTHVSMQLFDLLG